MVAQTSFFRRLYMYGAVLMGHGWDAVVFWVATVYSVWTAVVPLEIQKKVMLAVHVDPTQRLVIWGFGLAAFFLYAGFRAWDEEHAIVERNPESATATELATLRTELATLRTELDEKYSHEWPRLTDAQKTELVKRLKRIGPHTVWIVRPNNLDCIALAADFDCVFREALWDVPASEPYSIEEQKLGITIHSLMDAVEEAVRTAIIEATELPATIYRGSEIERKYRNEKVIVLSIGPKVF